ncbi:MAG TPA: hypothetical protein VFI09_07265 [Solirubrobacterales bacterium]|nr:hypothetical protein [Solirubrobacterales bacterium]
MNPHGNRTRLAGILVAAAAALALVALPGIASAQHGHDSLADAGTIQSFDPDSGVLTIDVTEGGSVSGLVTTRTHIHCDNGRHEGRHGLRHHLRHGATASDRGPGRGGDDGEGEDNHADGDDPPGHDGTAAGEDPGHGDEHGESCGADDLAAGKTVKFADLVLVDGKAIWSTVVLPQSEEETAG